LKREQVAADALAKLEQCDLDRARASVEAQMNKWAAKVGSLLKPADNEAQAALHGEIRRHVAGIKDARARMQFLEQRGSDIAVASALLEAPAFLSGLTESEIAFVRHKVEKEHLPAEIVEARARTTRALAELERAARAAPQLVLQHAGLKQPPKRTQPAPKAPAPKPISEADVKLPGLRLRKEQVRPNWSTTSSSSKPAVAPDWA